MSMWQAVGRLPARVLVLLVRIYQRTLSRILPPTCRFEPSCSSYMIGAVERHGAMRGLLLGVWRIMRCNPFNPGGLDPVPPRRNDKPSPDVAAENETSPR